MFRERVKIVLFLCAKFSGLFAISRWLTRRGLRILCYHGIWFSDGRFSRYLFMDGSRFAARLDVLVRMGFPVLPLDEAVRRLKDGTLPDGATVITIDDGWYGTYRDMVPELERRRLPTTIYLTTYYCENQLPVFDVALQFVLEKAHGRCIDVGALDASLEGAFALDDSATKERVATLLRRHARTLNGAGAARLLEDVTKQVGVSLDALVESRQFHLMTPAEAVDAVGRGIDLQLHTHRHRLATDDLQRLTTEIEDNRARLERMTGQHQRHFCYPSGEWNETVWPVLRASGIVSATTTDQGLNFPGAPTLGLRRLTDGDDVHEIEFEAELVGFGELLRRARRAIWAAR